MIAVNKYAFMAALALSLGGCLSPSAYEERFGSTSDTSPDNVVCERKADGDVAIRSIDSKPAINSDGTVEFRDEHCY